jgi:hypothetical protein
MTRTNGTTGVQEARYIQEIREGVSEIPERVTDYRRALLDHITEILILERGNREKRTNITQKVLGQTEALGKFLVDRNWGIEEGGH